MDAADRIAAELVEVRAVGGDSPRHNLWVGGVQVSGYTTIAATLELLADEVRAVIADAVRRALHKDRSAGVHGGLLGPAELAAIEARAAAATPGPWSVFVAEASGHCYVDCAAGRLDPGRRVASLGNRDGSLASAQFVAAARGDIPALLRHARALELLLADEGFRESLEAAERHGWHRAKNACVAAAEGAAGGTECMTSAIVDAVRGVKP